MTDPNRSDAGVAQCMDAYTVDQVGDEKVIVAVPNILSGRESEYVGCMLMGKSYIIDLCSNALKYGVVEQSDIENLISS